MRFAIICSAGGSAFFAAFDMLVKANRYSKEDFLLVTDRACGAEEEAINRGIGYQRIVFDTKINFQKMLLIF